MIYDTFNRKHDYLRISLTDRCNLRCAYCMPEEDYDFMPSNRLMQAHEIFEIAKTFVSLGVRKIRLTGGEPLVRKDFNSIIRSLAKLPVELAITTNGTLLHRHLGTLLETGVNKINISLDTLSPATFFRITRRDKFEQTFQNIRSAIDSGMIVKLNTVVMNGINDHELLDFVSLTNKENIEVRFIKFMPFADNGWSADKVVSKQRILDCIGEQFYFEEQQSEKNATSQVYKIDGHKGRFSVISTMTAPFCAGCNRMRLTADGKMKNCLFSAKESDLVGALRNGEQLEPIILRNVIGKAESLGGQFGDKAYQELEERTIVNRSMINIGG